MEAPPLPKRPPSVVMRQKSDDADSSCQPHPARSAPPRPSSKPPALPQRPTSLSPPGAINGTANYAAGDQSVAKLPPPRNRGSSRPTSSAFENNTGATKKRPEITIVSARPMSQVGFREEVPTSRPELSPPAGATQNTPGSASNKMPNVPPPRPKSITSPTGSGGGPPARPQLPSRPAQPNNGKSPESSSPDTANLIDLSEEAVTINQPVPKPRPRPAARTTIPTPDGENSETTLPSPMKPTRPTIIRSKPSETGAEPDKTGGEASEDQSGTKLPSYIHTTPSSDASVSELKAAFQKRQSGLSGQPVPAPKPKPKPKPAVAQKPNKPSSTENGSLNTNTSSVSNAEERLMADINNELSKGDSQSSPTAPSRRKRPTIIRPGVPQDRGDNSESAEKMVEEYSSRPPPLIKSPVGRPASPTLARKELFNEGKKSSENIENSATARPKPAARKITPPPKSMSDHDLKSAQLSTPQHDVTSQSLTPPPRKRKTGPPRPTQRPLSGSLSQNSLSDKANSASSLPTDKGSSETKPSRPSVAPPSRPQAGPSKPAPSKSSISPSDPSGPGSRKIIIHEVYPQSQAPKLPPRPGPGHPLFHYMMNCPYGIGVATHDYQSLHTDELSFLEGDILVLLKLVDASWYRGKNGEIEGIFPANFVKVMEPLSDQGTMGSRQRDVGAESNLLVDFGDGVDQDSGSGPRCQARFDYDGEGSEDLTFLEGEIITLLERVGDDWFRGELRGKTGIFPSTFVEVIEDLPATPESSVASPANHGLIRTAMYAFRGEEGELSFKAGDSIKLISYVNSDWLFGEANGKQGQFPSAFIDDLPLHLPQHVTPKKEKHVVESFKKKSSEEPKFVKAEEKPLVKVEKKVEQIPLQSPQSDSSAEDEAYCIAIHEFSGETAEDLKFREADKIILIEWVNSDWLKGKLDMTGQVGIFPAAYVQIIKDLKHKAPSTPTTESEDTAKTKVKAVYDFSGEGDQELTFKEGEIFTMVGSPKASEEWGTGEINGQIGLFPVSFVEEFYS